MERDPTTPGLAPEIAPAGRHAAIGFILMTLLLDILGIGLIIPVLPDLVELLAGGDDSLTSLWYGGLITAYALMQFLFAPLIGALSDRYGRRPVLLVSIAVLGLDFLLTAMAPNLWWLLGARILSGMTAANITAANAYIADISDDTTRVRNFGLAGAMFGLGFVLGPVLGGIAGLYSPRLPFLLAAGLSAINFLYGWLVLPESLPVEKRHWPSLVSLLPGKALQVLQGDRVIFGLSIAFFCTSFAEMTLRSTWILFTKENFHWNTIQNGIALSFVGVMTALVQATLLRPVSSRIGERATLIAGLVISIGAYLCYAFATEGWMMYAIIAFGAFGGMAGPAAQSIVAKRVDAGEQGRVQGALASISSLTAIIAPPIATGAFWLFTTSGLAPHFPGVSFLIAAIMVIAATVIATGATRVIARASPQGGKSVAWASPLEDLD
jgi:DHA1 family tetracycline resistance protein-like MFS transporter